MRRIGVSAFIECAALYCHHGAETPDTVLEDGDKPND
jgi:hypothetical protein